MPRKHKILYTPAAVDDVDEIFSYITQENLGAAEAMLGRINDGITRLAEYQNLGSVLPEDEYTLAHRGYRFIVIQPHLVFYRVLNEAVVIHRILHGRRDYLRELFSGVE